MEMVVVTREWTELKRFLTIGALALLVTGAQAASPISYRGGEVIRFALHVQKLKASGEELRIGSTCQSACTMYLGLPRGKLCMARGVSFRFHRAYGSPNDKFANKFMMDYYPGWVRSWIASQGGLSNRIITMPHKVAAKHVRICR